MDVDDVPMSSRLGFARELYGILQDLREGGASVYSATRDRKFRSDSWGDAPAMEMTVGYLVIVPADRQLAQLYIPRRTRLPNGMIARRMPFFRPDRPGGATGKSLILLYP